MLNMIKLSLNVIIFFGIEVSLISSLNINQYPSNLLRTPEQREATLNCRHGDTNYPYMFWYQQKSVGGTMELIGMLQLTRATPEEKFKARFNISGHSQKDAFLIISDISTTDSAVYFCAASLGQGGGANQAYFGGGTKLTVLEKGRSAESPKVEILNVSSTEVCNKEAVTLVCLASKFYPDHVSVSWDMNGEEMGNVATDNAATRDDKYYSISSRLQIPYQTWTTGKTFTCTVKFFNGTGYENHPASIRGPVDSGRNEAATFVKSGKTTMLAYGMIIVKSVIYGIFIIVVIKKQDFRGK